MAILDGRTDATPHITGTPIYELNSKETEYFDVVYITLIIMDNDSRFYQKNYLNAQNLVINGFAILPGRGRGGLTENPEPP